MGVVKYSGSVASFHCPTNAEIRSLKVHFSPKQLGEGDPSPENVREIVGWDGVEVWQSGKNIITEDIQWLPDKWIIDNGKLRVSVYNTFVVPIPKGTFYLHKIDKSLAYGGLIDRLPVAGDSAYNSVTLTSYQIRLIDNSDGHPYLLLCGPTGTITQSPAEYCYERKIWIDAVNPSVFSEPSHGSTTNYEFGVLGKNKFDKSQCIDGARLMKTDGSNYTSDSANYYISPFIPVVSGATYTKNSPIIDAYHRFATYTSNDVSSFVRVLDNSNTITIEPNETYIRFCGLITEKDTTQLELGSTATAYEPYDPNKTVYGGWVDLINGEVQQEWTEPLTLGEPYYYGGNVCFGYTYPNKYTPYSDNLPADRIYSTFSKSNFYINTKNNFIFGGDSTFAKTDGNGNLNPEWTNWYNSLETKPTISLQLYEPITYHLAPTQLQTFLGHNNVWSNADYVEVEYDLHETQNILARKQFIMANQPHIVKPAAAPLQNFVTDMAAPVKGCKVYFSPVQEGEGDPSPENVRAISGWTGCEMYRANHNLLTYNEDGLYPVFLPKGTAVVVSSASGDGYNQVQYYRKDKSQIDYWNLNQWQTEVQRYKRPFTLLEDAFYFSFNYPDRNVQLELGSTATIYEPYSGTMLPIDWATEAGTVYGGYVDLVTGEVVQTYYKIIADGVNIKANSKYWDANREMYGGGIVYINPIGKFANSSLSNIFCDILEVTRSIIIDHQHLYVPAVGKLYAVFYLFNISDTETELTKQEVIDQTNAWLQEHPTTIIYELAEPIHYSLTTTALKTLRGTNNIWSNANGNIELSYWKH